MFVHIKLCVSLNLRCTSCSQAAWEGFVMLTLRENLEFHQKAPQEGETLKWQLEPQRQLIPFTDIRSELMGLGLQVLENQKV